MTELYIPQYIWNRVDGYFDRVESAPKLPLCADDWEIAIGDDLPPAGDGWYFVSATPCESNVAFQRSVMVVWARRKS